MTEYNYDFKQLVRDICNSQTYQRSTERNASNQDDEKNFAHSRIRRIPAESLLDCYSQVTETQEKFPGLPLGARAVQIANGQSVELFSDHVRPLAADDGLCLRGHDRADAFAGLAPVERRHAGAQGRPGARRSQAARSPAYAGPSRGDVVHPLPVAQADAPRDRAIPGR